MGMYYGTVYAPDYGSTSDTTRPNWRGTGCKLFLIEFPVDHLAYLPACLYCWVGVLWSVKLKVLIYGITFIDGIGE